MVSLDAPLTLPSGLVLPHRVVKAPMTENLADADNQPTAAHERLYGRWAAGAAGGLLITGNLMVDRRYLERSRNIVADRHLDVARLAAVREAGRSSPMIAQLNHPGRQTNRFLASRPVAPSADAGAVRMMGLFARPRALAPLEIESIVDGFGQAAARCEQAGMDGVQVHAAHGYLLAQFLSPYVNRRADEWGGDLAGRSRALVSAVRAVRASTGPNFTVAVKLNSSDFRHGGFTEDDAEAVVGMLVEEGVDLIEISGGTYENPALFGEVEGLRGETSEKEAYFAGFARRVRSRAASVPLILSGGIRTRSAMEELLSGDGVDLIGLGRPLAIDPDYTRRILDGDEGAALPRYTLPTVAGLAGESEWYERQIARIGAGQAPTTALHPAVAAARFVGGEMGRGLAGRRRRARLVAQG
ncbi:NADH:flavin oxidoreductase [Nocardioides sp. R-C-SC26]|uniref:oxidoreductase n=1 Tax=Nocardioides sp. R-C-SC26 TaxID=2870414 RepID=UPI001E630B1B|nr:NADH:flavin oxidoreductase [Nocardioides sp. R-C-SC26]